MKSATQYSFARVPQVEIPRSSFDRSMTYKTAFNEGLLIPFYVDEALPGDTFSLNMTAFSRLATPVVPFMDNLYMDFQFFAVPIRLVWDNFVKMMGEQVDPGDSIDYLVPQVALEDPVEVGSIFDYMGIPPGYYPHDASQQTFSSLWCRAYNLIWNEWYRDENLQQSVPVNRDDQPDSSSDFTLLRRGKRHDYFTSCLPWPQKGPGVEIPLGDAAPVLSNGATPLFNAGSGERSLWVANNTNSYLGLDGSTVQHQAVTFGSESGLYADLTTASGATINTLRQAFQIQRLLERDARGGTRYTELLRSHFGVVSPDARLQRPEYLGGGTIPIQIHSVAQTSATDSVTPQGNLAAYGIAAKSGVGFSKSFTEHTLLLGLVSVRADLTYQHYMPTAYQCLHH